MDERTGYGFCGCGPYHSWTFTTAFTHHRMTEITDEEWLVLGGQDKTKPGTSLHIADQTLAFRLIDHFFKIGVLNSKNASAYRTRWKKKFAPHLIIKRYNNSASKTAANTSLPNDDDDDDDLFDESAHARKQQEAITRLEKEKEDLTITIQKHLQLVNNAQKRLDIIEHKLQKWASKLIPSSIHDDDDHTIPPPLEAYEEL